MSGEESNQDNPPAAFETPDEQRAAAAPTESQLENQIPGGRGAAGHDAYAAWRFRDYRLYQTGWMIAVMGFQIENVALGWELYDRTQSPMALGYLGLAQAIPVVALALPGGQIADWFDRRKVIFVTVMLQAILGVGLGLASYRDGSIPYMYALVAGIASVLAIARPARQALLPQVVPLEVVNNAITWNSSVFEVSSMLGPAIGGAIIAYSVRSAYFINAGCAVAFACLMLFLRFKSPPRKREPLTASSVLAGVRFVRQKRIILGTITLDLFAVLLGGAVYLLPVFAKDVLGVGKIGFGLLRAAPGLGAVVMALALAHLPPMKHAGRNLLLAVGGFGLATIVFGLSRSFTLSLVMLMLTGALDNISVVVRHTLVQVLTPDAMRGRVSAVNQVFIGASNEIGGLESGLTAAWWGATAAVVFGGVGTLVVVAAVALAWPEVRRFGSLHDARPD